MKNELIRQAVTNTFVTPHIKSKSFADVALTIAREMEEHMRYALDSLRDAPSDLAEARACRDLLNEFLGPQLAHYHAGIHYEDLSNCWSHSESLKAMFNDILHPCDGEFFMDMATDSPYFLAAKARCSTVATVADDGSVVLITAAGQPYVDPDLPAESEGGV